MNITLTRPLPETKLLTDVCWIRPLQFTPELQIKSKMNASDDSKDWRISTDSSARVIA